MSFAKRNILIFLLSSPMHATINFYLHLGIYLYAVLFIKNLIIILAASKSSRIIFSFRIRGIREIFVKYLRCSFEITGVIWLFARNIQGRSTPGCVEHGNRDLQTKGLQNLILGTAKQAMRVSQNSKVPKVRVKCWKTSFDAWGAESVAKMISKGGPVN